MADDTLKSDDLDFDNRRLCPDGACIGVLDAQGRCKECGKTWTDPYRGGRIDADAEDEEGWEDDEDDEGWEDDEDDEDTASAAGGWDEDRELCPDGACIGVIGPDGTCKECGKPRA